MNFLEEIKYRNELNKKVFSGVKLTAEEKRWFKINPMFNEKYESQCYQMDVVKLNENTSYHITVNIEHSDKAKIIMPVISVAIGSGSVLPKKDTETTKKSEEFSSKARGIILSQDYPTSVLQFVSKEGYLSIYYKCQYFDPKTRVHVIEPSILKFTYGMKREIVADNIYRYSCKHPLDETDNFSAMIFTVKWEKV